MGAIRLAAFLAALCSITGAQAKELMFGSWAVPNHGVNVHGLAPLFKELEEKTGGVDELEACPRAGSLPIRAPRCRRSATA